MSALAIDHVHVEVADRDRAAEWYALVLGLTRHAGLAVWADDPMGPLLLGTAQGTPMLSLFARDCAAPSRDCTIAFRMSGEDFLSFVDSAGSKGVSHNSGAPLGAQHIEDHDLSWSVYFGDPDGNRLEVTTYDYDAVAQAIR